VKLVKIKDVLVDGTSDPKLKGTAIFFNPNDKKGKLKRVNVDIYVDGKKAGTIDQHLKTVIPAKAEFSVPLEVNLHMKELGFLDTLLGVLGGKKFEVRYEGSLKLTYHGIPIKVPIKYKDEIRVKF
jgi:LEA14-like dessication related protein